MARTIEEVARTSRLILLTGNEDKFRMRALVEALAAVDTRLDDPETGFYDGADSMGEWFGSAMTLPFFSERRVVVVRNVTRADYKEASSLAWNELPEQALLLLVADDEDGDDDRGSKTAARRDGWEKLISKVGGHVEKFTSSPREAAGAIRKEAERLDKKLSPKAADLLLEMVGGKLSRALDELEKLAVSVGDADSILERDVKTLVIPAAEWNVFTMTDAISRRAVAEALRELRKLIDSPAKAEEAAYRNIFPLLSRSLRLLWQARVCYDGGRNIEHPTAKELAAFLEKPNLASEPPYRLRSLAATAKTTTLESLAKRLQLLAEADSRLKGGLPGLNPADTLERMVIEMCLA